MTIHRQISVDGQSEPVLGNISITRKFDALEFIKARADSHGYSDNFWSKLLQCSEEVVATLRSDQIASELSLKALALTPALEVVADLEQVINPNYVGSWLQLPNPAFGGEAPIELLKRLELEPLREMIFRLESGEPS